MIAGNTSNPGLCVTHISDTFSDHDSSEFGTAGAENSGRQRGILQGASTVFFCFLGIARGLAKHFMITLTC